ncbi:Reverse transcriptase zinc-binding domain [Macleaya cordata]|uniref:Reverse transcriptase zinc-binding domain n=1 Tax=Macleaya cordata TaxID=56857 RepID=A0A200QCK3_MACCD|nr:Reverse transcriptase zinc-binding domain [Macleaya cordata]
MNIIREFWVISGDHSSFASKCESLLTQLKNWSRATFGHIDKELKKLMEELLQVQGLPPTDENLQRINELSDKFNEYTNHAATYWEQRAKSHWIRDHDRNTKYFHTRATNRRRKNHISSIKRADGTWTTSFEEISSCLINHFQYLFTASPTAPIMPAFRICHHPLTTEQNLTISLISKIAIRLTGWKRDSLSHAGRLQLIKSTLASITVYFMSAYLLPKGVLEKILSIQRNFWWNNSEDHQSLMFTAWSNLCKPKMEGGLGIRIPERVNTSLIMNLTWRFLTQPHSIWCQLLSAKYLKANSFWLEKKHWNPSPIWSSICAVKKHMQEATCWSVGDGHHIKIWTDPWVPSIHGFRVMGLDHAKELVNRVADLIFHDSRCWNEALIFHCFPTHEAKAILSIRLSAERDEDQLLWLKTPSGNFTAKSAYNLLSQREPSSSTNSTDGESFNWKGYWQLKGISPRVHLFLWRILTKSLALKSSIARFNSSVDPSCPMCHLSLETYDHLFLKCDIARQIWFGSDIGLVIDRNDPLTNLRRIFNQWISSPNTLEIAKRGCALLWTLWKSRNRVVFDNAQIDITQIIREAHRIYHEHQAPPIFHGLNNTLIEATVSISNQNLSWEKPPPGTIKINVDGATGNNSIAAGIIARNEEGMVLACRTFFDGCWTGKDAPIEAEANAFLKGLELSAHYPNTPSIIEGDSKMIVTYITDDRLLFPWRIRSIILDSRQLLRSNLLSSVRFVPRTKNKAAHCLARQAINCKTSNYWILSSPCCISEVLASDDLISVI